MSQFNRRSFLIGAAGTGLLAACGSDSGGASPGTTTSTLSTSSPSSPAFLSPSFPDRFVVHGQEQRIAYALHDGVSQMTDQAPATVQFAVSFDGDQVGGGLIDRRAEGIFVPYYPVRFTPPAAGVYTVNLPEYPAVAPHEFVVADAAEGIVPQVGTILPSVATATFDDARGVTPICTRTDPCPFHELDLADALGSGDKPTVLSIATPGFCQTAICGPVIDLLIDVAAARTDINVIHSEVYVDPQRDLTAAGGAPELVDVAEVYGLPLEPVLFVAAADGTLLGRLDAIYDRSELSEAIALI